VRVGALAAGTKNLKDHRKLLLERRAIIARHSVLPARTPDTTDTNCSFPCYHSGPGKGKRKATRDRKKNKEKKGVSRILRMLCASWCNKTGRSRRRLLPGGGGWGARPAVGSLFFLPSKGQAWQHFRAFFLNGLQGAGVEPRRFEDRCSDLPRLDHPRVNAGSVAGVGDDQQ
jgi:hypothetical protein